MVTEHAELRVRPKEFGVVKETDWAVPEDWFISPIPGDFVQEGPTFNGADIPWFAFSRFSGALHLLSPQSMGLLEKIHGAEFVDQTFPLFSELREAGLVLAPGEKRRVTVSPGKRTEVWLKANDICQLACDGCFDGQANSDEMKERKGVTRIMTEPIIEKIADETLEPV